MQRHVRRAAHRQHHGEGVLERFHRHDVARLDAALHQVHQRLAALVRHTSALIVDGRRRRVARQRHPERLGHARHRIGREQAAARADARARRALEFVQVLVGDQPGFALANRLIHILNRHVLAAELARLDRAAVNKNARHIHAADRHKCARQALVAASQPDERVVAMRAHHQLDRVGDHVAAHERRLHAFMPHTDAVAHRNRDKFAWRAAHLTDALLRFLRQKMQRHVARRGFVPGTGNADQRLAQILVAQSHRTHERTMRRARDAFEFLAFLFQVFRGFLLGHIYV